MLHPQLSAPALDVGSSLPIRAITYTPPLLRGRSRNYGPLFDVEAYIEQEQANSGYESMRLRVGAQAT